MVMDDEFTGKKIVILGLARQGKALARFAVGAGARVVVSDKRIQSQMEADLLDIKDLPVELVLGDHPTSLLADADFLAISGGVPADIPLVLEAKKRGIPVTNDSFEFMKRTPATVIGITGSAGKSTTTALTGSMLQAAAMKTWVGGNIGQPLIASLEEMGKDDVVVQELSSFQLEQWTSSPPIAAVLNITPNHLDRHKDMTAYTEAKSNILRYQSKDNVAVLSADDPGCKGLRDMVRGRQRYFSLIEELPDGSFIRDDEIWLSDGKEERALCHIKEILLRGRHNILNVQAAALLADSAGAGREAIRTAILEFRGVEHRLEMVRSINGVRYINDSIATAPERAMAAIDSFSEPLVLLAGGKDKQLVWTNWVTKVTQRVRSIILFGDLGRFLEELLEVEKKSTGFGPEIRRVDSLDEAVELAAVVAQAGEIVLLSPGGTSFDAFKDFAERGQRFRQLVLLIQE